MIGYVALNGFVTEPVERWETGNEDDEFRVVGYLFLNGEAYPVEERTYACGSLGDPASDAAVGDRPLVWAGEVPNRAIPVTVVEGHETTVYRDRRGHVWFEVGREGRYDRLNAVVQFTPPPPYRRRPRRGRWGRR